MIVEKVLHFLLRTHSLVFFAVHGNPQNLSRSIHLERRSASYYAGIFRRSLYYGDALSRNTAVSRLVPAMRVAVCLDQLERCGRDDEYLSSVRSFHIV